MAQPARKSERGLTLVETIVALAIVFIVFLGLTDVGLLVLDYNINNVVRDEGVKVSEKVMADARGLTFSTLDAEPEGVPVALDNEVRQIRGFTVTYAPTRTVSHLNPDNLQVVVGVTWIRGAWTPSGREQRNYSHQVVSIVSNR